MQKIDIKFIEALKNDDENAYERLRLLSYSYAIRYLKNHEDSEDIATDALINIKKTIKRYKPLKGKGNVESNFMAWVKKIVFNAYLTLREQRQREATFVLLSAALNLNDDERDAIENDHESIDRILSLKVYDPYSFNNNPQWRLAVKDVLKATKKLKSPKKRIALLLMYLFGFTEREIAILMKENFHAIQTVIQRARKEMKVIYEEEGIDAGYLSPEFWKIKHLIH